MTTRLHHNVTNFVMLAILIWCSRSMVHAQVSMAPSFDCQIDHAEVHSVKRILKTNQLNYLIDTIGVYLVCDFALYQQYQGDTTAISTYVNLLWDQVQSIYSYDSIPLMLSGVKIWQEQDPYNHSTGQSSLTSFADLTGSAFPGRLAHLLSGSQGNKGGIAFLNGFCDPTRAYGYANVNGYIDTTAYYNWDVHVLAHEIGHNLGSPHTNDCIWGPNNDTALDGCGQLSNSCADANIPTGGGSVMSSCHQYPEGIIMDQGIGEAPAQVMKSLIRSCSDYIGLSCENPFTIDKMGIYTASPINLGNGAQQSDASHSKWYQYISPTDQTLDIASCNQGVDTRLHVYKGICNQLKLIGQSDDDCASYSGLRYASKLQLEISQGDTILIEWDNRWSSQSFDFTLSNDNNTCNNGIKDGDEEETDCGGTSCTSCVDACSDLLPLSSIIDNTIYFRTADMLQYNGLILSGANAILASNKLVEIHTGFEVKMGGNLEVVIEDCRLTTQSLEE